MLFFTLEVQQTSTIFSPKFMCTSVLLASMWTWVEHLQSPEEGNGSHGNGVRWLWATMWALGTKPWSSARPGGTLNHWAICPALIQQIVKTTMHIILPSFINSLGHSKDLELLLYSISMLPIYKCLQTNVCPNVSCAKTYSSLKCFYICVCI